MTIRALVVDDEHLARRALRQLLAQVEDVEVAGECADAEDAAVAVRERGVDVVFLDVRMPAISGITLARGLGARPVVVFVTAHEEYAVPAFDVGAADYLLKPVTARRLATALSRVRARLAADAAPGAARPLDRLAVRSGAKELLVPVAEVTLFAADDVHVTVHAGGRALSMRASLDDLERRLDPSQFIRTHRSYLVPVSQVVAIHRARDGSVRVELRSGAAVPVSRRRRRELRRLLALTAARG